jgi:3-oxoacyl-[acyl-carrier protein] reductase
MDLGLQGRVALVTGGWRGIGSGISAGLAREGATVLVHGFEAGQPDAVVAGIRAAGGRAEPVVGALLGADGAAEVAAAVAAVAPAVDVLVANYGLAQGDGWLETDPDDWIETYERNVLAGVRLVHHLVPGMVERGWGRVVLLGTVGSARPGDTRPGYYAAKASLPSIAVSLSRSLRGTGVTVNVVSPGIIATAEVQEVLARRAERTEAAGGTAPGGGSGWSELVDNPSGRVGTLDDVADLVAFVASDRAGFVNGANLRIDGGAAATPN